MKISSSLPTLSGISDMPNYTLYGSPQVECEDLIRAATFAVKVRLISECIKDGFNKSGFILQIKDSTLYVFIVAHKNHFDPHLTEPLSLDIVAEDYNSIKTMCDIAVICEGISLSEQNDIVVDVSDDMIEF